MVNYVPEGTHTLTPHLVVNDARKAIAFYEKALGAQELYHMDAPGGRSGTPSCSSATRASTSRMRGRGGRWPRPARPRPSACTSTSRTATR